MPNDNVNAYTNYFRGLAIYHKDIQHNPASETGGAAPGAKKFTRWGIDEVVTGLRTKMGWPALLLELYEVQTTGENQYDIKGNYNGAFTVLDRADVNNYTSEMTAFQKTESIYRDLLKKIWQDHFGPDAEFCTRVFSFFAFEKLIITPVGPLFDNQFGWRIEFSFRPALSFDLTGPIAEGTFITPAP